MAAAAASSKADSLDELLNRLATLTAEVSAERAIAAIPVCKQILKIDPTNQLAKLFLGYLTKVKRDPKLAEAPEVEDADEGESGGDSDSSDSSEDDELPPTGGAGRARAAGAASSAPAGRVAASSRPGAGARPGLKAASAKYRVPTGRTGKPPA